MRLQEQDEDANISISDIRQTFNDNDMKEPYTTIKQSWIDGKSKDILVRYKNGKKFFYRSTIDRNEATKSAVQNVSSQFFGGDYIQMLRFN